MRTKNVSKGRVDCVKENPSISSRRSNCHKHQEWQGEGAGGWNLCYACYLNACCKYSVRRGKSSATAAARHSACLQLACSSNCSCLESREISRLPLCLPVCVSLCACAAHCSSFRFRLPLPLPSLLLLLLSLLPFRGFEATFQFQFADGNAKR